MKSLLRLLACGAALVIPSVVFAASASITEIMYDLPGTDTGREWIEVQNTGTDDVSFSKWKLFEANTNHGINLFQGNATTSSNGFAVIADDVSKFLADNPGFSGTLFSSSFSLSNSGETLELKFENTSVYQITYSSSVGAAGDGNSLQLINGVWQAKPPTPGNAASGAATSSPPAAPETGTTTPPQNASPETAPPPSKGSGSTWTFTPQIYVSAFIPDEGVAGAPLIFDAVAVGTKKEPLPNARYVWSFGDGGTAEGKKVEHTYHYPAAYTVMVEAASSEWSATDRGEVVIRAPELIISSIKEGGSGFIELTNNGKSEVNLSHWLLQSGAGLFTIPQGTFIGAHNTIPFPAAITNLSADTLSTSLLYPNGTPVTMYAEKNATPEPASAKVETPTITRAAATPVKEVEPEKPAPKPVKEVKKAPQKQNDFTGQASSTLTGIELMGAVGAAGEGGSMTRWLLGVTLLIAVSIGGYLAMLRPKGEPTAAEMLRNEAAAFDILE